MEKLLARAQEVVAACASGGSLVAAADSRRYQHVWARDVGIASLGICAAESTVAIDALRASLDLLAAHQSELGRIPLKVDPDNNRAVAENSAGIDSGLWFAVAVHAVAEVCGAESVAHLLAPAKRALDWSAHLDVDGSSLLCAPEAGGWADMLPHRHHVLYINVVYVLALRALARLLGEDAGGHYARQADLVQSRINLLLWLGDVTDPTDASARIEKLTDANFEWGITGQYATRYGALPFYLSYSGFRTVGRHFDSVGNFLAIAAGIADDHQRQSILDHAAAVGLASPQPSKTLDPPIYPGDADWRDHFHWRNLCVPHHYQNGGCWPFAGALHVAALVQAGRNLEADQLLHRLAAACTAPGAEFPEWFHGVTGEAMGEHRQLWSATGLLFAHQAVAQGKVPVLEGLRAWP